MRPASPMKNRVVWEDDPVVQQAIADGQAEIARQALEAELHDGAAEHGSVDAYLEHIRLQRQLDGDRRLASAVASLLRGGGAKAVGTLHPAQKRRLLRDRELAAYWVSVARAGDAGWAEERTRVRQHQHRALRSSEPEKRLGAFEREAIRRLVPQWRAWGRLLLEADAVPELNDVIRTFEDEHGGLWE